MSDKEDVKERQVGAVDSELSQDNSIPSSRDGEVDVFAEVAHPPRTIGALEVLSAGFNVCNSWAGVAASMFLAIFQGGPVTIIYGCIVILFLMGATALSLAELSARYPTAGGQYHWTAILAPKKYARGMSYTVGTINMFGWVAICAGICIIMPQIIMGIVVFYNNDFVILQWHSFLIYQVLNVSVLVYNLFILPKAAWTHNIGFALSLLCFIIFFITCLAIAGPKQPNEYVWNTFVNDSGWPDGIVFLTGLVNPNFMYSGLDGAIHLAEDCINASTAVPQALMATIVIGFVTTFAFVVAMFYCISDFDAVLMTPTAVPIYEIWNQATKSETAATIFIVLLLLTGIFALNASQMHQGLGVPPYALFFNSFVVFIIGCIYLGSTTAFSAIIGTGLVLQQLTFAIPAALLMIRGRAPQYLPSSGRWNLGKFGWFVNGVTVAWSALQLVLYNLPLALPVSGSTMNYTCAVLGCMAIFALVNWFAYARTRYAGPKIDLTKFHNVPFGKPSDEGVPGELLGVPPNTRRLIVSKDHMGIRNIRPVVDGVEPSEDGSAWYEVLGEPNASLDAEIEVLYNGLFLRRVRSTITDQNRERGTWTITCPPLVSPYNVDCIEEANQGSSWLHYTQLDADVKGLTVCRWDNRNIGFHFFTGLTVDYRRFVSHMKQQYSDSFLTWMYFPINPGESITDVWTRKDEVIDENIRSSGPSVVLETSLCRTMTFGAYIPYKETPSSQPTSQMRPHQSRSLLRSGDGAISGIFHNGFDPISPFITEFGVICDSRRARKPSKQIPSSQVYLYPTPWANSLVWTYEYEDAHDEWYLTKAPLEGLTEVQFCQDREQRKHPCIGLILHYGDGHTESLGQFRWDLTVSDIIITPIRIEICSDEDRRFNNP
ncbi:hypothetical protein VE04_03247 [Pseudogymnoascus sp. 24MN13]|nr:hypothetical protein VE04_03247 [Pseudogymnoascus sp. 24MN13]